MQYYIIKAASENLIKQYIIMHTSSALYFNDVVGYGPDNNLSSAISFMVCNSFVSFVVIHSMSCIWRCENAMALSEHVWMDVHPVLKRGGAVVEPLEALGMPLGWELIFSFLGFLLVWGEIENLGLLIWSGCPSAPRFVLSVCFPKHSFPLHTEIITNPESNAWNVKTNKSEFKEPKLWWRME